MRSIDYLGLGTRFAAWSVVLTTGCGLRDGEKGSLRRLFDGELPALEAPDDRRGRDAGGRDDDTTRDDGTRTTSGRTTTDGDSTDDGNSTDDDTDVGPVSPGVNPTNVNPTLDPNDVEPTSDDTGVNPTTEATCDDDTSGLTLGEECTVGVGGCERTGEVVCLGEGLTCSVTAGRPLIEECNGIDDDCDGELDEVTSGLCFVGSGGCEREGTWVCVDGDFACDAEVVLAQPEQCNGVDDDCDDYVDEDFDLHTECRVGVGKCARSGLTMCSNLAVVCDAVAGEAESEVCNGADDDCDGETDEGFDVGADCTVGVGACQSAGQIVCSNDEPRCNASATQPGDEYCNDEDDDCDGELDDENVCPDDVVQNTKPFNDGVWYTASTSSCGGERVLQFWPELNEDTVYSDFPCYAWMWTFRPTDGALFVHDSEGDGAIVRHFQGDPWEVVETPGCNPNAPYFFDGEGQLHYPCSSISDNKELRRGATGELVRSDIGQLYQVTSDGRMLVSIASELTLLDPDGDILDVYQPSAEYAGDMTIEYQRVTASGNDLFVLYRRRLPSFDWELVMFRINEDNELLLVRRLYFGDTEPSNNLLPLSDGSILEELPDPEGVSTDMVRRYAPDGTESIVWRESETTFTTHISDQLLIGPRL